MIDRFDGEYKFLSNFYPAPVLFENILYPTVEHAYQAAKTLDPEERKYVLDTESPGKVKRASRAFKMREDWEEIKLDIMFELVNQKFTTHEDLKQKLLDTGMQDIVEGNNWGDKFWGVCDGEGRNELGKIIMSVRYNFQLEKMLRESSGVS